LATRSPVVENEVSNRPPYDDTSQHALWNTERNSPRSLPMFRRVIVAHVDAPAGESISLMLGLKEFPSIYAPDLCSTRRLLDDGALKPCFWIRVSTSMPISHSSAASLPIRPNADRLVIALSSIYPEDSMETLQAAGFDGHCRRPCPIWRLSDILSEYFDRAPYP